MKTDTAEKLVAYIAAYGPQKPDALASHLHISTQAVHAQIRKLLARGELIRLGKPPETHYAIAPVLPTFPSLDSKIAAAINQHFSYLDPAGSLAKGIQGFNSWIISKKLTKDYLPLASAYENTLKTTYGDDNVIRPINTLPRIQSILSDCVLDSATISDFYAIPQFGETHLGNLIHAIKSSFNRVIFDEIYNLISADIQQICRTLKIDGVVYTPHSIPRKQQFLPALRKRLQLTQPEIFVNKIFQDNIPVAQKTLSKLNERIENANKTMLVEPFAYKFNHVLIIDDAIGSGATINELAKKLKHQYGVKHCHAYAVVGSYKGFDVISAV